jgi:hypothetical protein
MVPARDSPDSAPPPEPRSWLLRFGGVVGAGALGSAMAAAPAALRLQSAPGTCTPLGTWALLFGAAIVPMSLAVLALRRARSGFLALGKGGGMAPVLLGWWVSCFAGLTLLGAMLRARTHHRALGGVTFALAAFVLTVLSALFCLRMASAARKASPSSRWALAAVFAAVLGFAVAMARHRLSAALPFPTSEGAKLVDGLAFALSAFIVSGHPFVDKRVLALVGPPAAAILMILGVSSWRACPSLRDALEERAPMFAWLVRQGPSEPR